MAFPTITTHDAGGLTQTVNTMPDAGQKTKAESLSMVLASDSDALPVTPTSQAWTSWTGSSTSLAMNLDAIEFQLSALTGTGPWTPQRSSNGTNWDACQVMDQFNTFIASLTSAHAGKMLSADGRAFFRLYSATGGDTVTGMIRAS